MNEQHWELQDDPELSQDPYCEVIKEIEKLHTHQEKRTKYLLVFFLISAIAFYFSISGRMKFEFAVILMVVILVHEAGHYFAMKKFGYRDLKIIFIPFFGAATHGKNLRITSWKEAVVDLAGPIPGVLLGAFLFFLGSQFSEYNFDFKPYAVTFIIVNFINLLPIPMLDGANFIVHASQARLPILAAVSRILSLALLSLISPYFLFFGLAVALFAIEEYGESKAARAIRSEYPHLLNNQKLDRELIEIIIRKLERASSLNVQPEDLAKKVLRVFGNLSGAPLSLKWVGALWAVYVSGLLLSFYILSTLKIDLASVF
jgi:Zn-dependent protease